MTNPSEIKQLRCAIYTRKSTEHGLEQEFNSLDAQREACEAYIKSQLHERWVALSTRYDDPAFSGGNLDRPALKRLLADIDAGLVDVVVVYKIDRLTRSLADFAKLVEAFDAKSISFVAVTQQFNTTTSMGRLTLNVLLSFAQFERELSSERVKDKIAASRKKGKWTGGGVPLGYINKNKKLEIDPKTAPIVREIFERYLALKSFQRLIDELDQKQTVPGTRGAPTSKSRGTRFTYGPLAYLLKNRTYLGEMGHKGAWFPGEHKAIIDRDVFERVQELMRTNSDGRTGRRQKGGALLTGFLFDDKGNRMSPSFTVKLGARYSFYVSSAILKGRKHDAGSITRVSAVDLDAAVLNALNSHIVADRHANAEPGEALKNNVSSITIGGKIVIIKLKGVSDSAPGSITIPWDIKKKRLSATVDHTNELSTFQNPILIQALVRARAWVKSLSDGTFGTVEELALDAGLHPKVVRKRIRLAYLPPDVTKSILQGTQPVRMTVRDLVALATVGWPPLNQVLQQSNR